MIQLANVENRPVDQFLGVMVTAFKRAADIRGIPFEDLPKSL